MGRHPGPVESILTVAIGARNAHHSAWGDNVFWGNVGNMPRRKQFFPEKSWPMAVAALAAVILLAVQPQRLGNAAEAKNAKAKYKTHASTTP